MTIEVMKVKGTQRAFYRLYVLPLHIAKRTGEDAEVLKEELKRHKKYVKDNGLEAELQAYLEAQKNRQALYDKMMEERGKFAAMKGAGLNQSIRDLAEQEEVVANAEIAFEEAKVKFKEEYH